MPILDPRTHTVTSSWRRCVIRTRRRRSGPDMLPASSLWRLRPTGATRRSGTPGPTTTTACSTSQGRVWFAAAVRGRRQPRLLQEGLRPSFRQSVPAGPDERVRSRGSIPRRCSTPSSTPALGRITCSSAMMRTTRLWTSGGVRWPAGSTPRCSTRPVTRRKSQGWTAFILDTNGNGEAGRTRRAEPAARPDQGQAYYPSGLYAVMPSPVDGSIWCTVGVFGGTPAVCAL